MTGCGSRAEIASGQTRYLTVILIVVFALDGAASRGTGAGHGHGQPQSEPAVCTLVHGASPRNDGHLPVVHNRTTPALLLSVVFWAGNYGKYSPFFRIKAGVLIASLLYAAALKDKPMLWLLKAVANDTRTVNEAKDILKEAKTPDAVIASAAVRRVSTEARSAPT